MDGWNTISAEERARSRVGDDVGTGPSHSAYVEIRSTARLFTHLIYSYPQQYWGILLVFMQNVWEL